MNFNFKNSWKAFNKQKDRFKVEFRLFNLTVLNIEFDLSKKQLELMLLNFGIKVN